MKLQSNWHSTTLNMRPRMVADLCREFARAGQRSEPVQSHFSAEVLTVLTPVRNIDFG